MYTDNHKTLLKEIREALNKWKVIPCSWLEGLILLRCRITQSSLEIQCNLFQNPKDVLCRKRKFHLKIHIESQGNPDSQNNKVGGFALPDFNLAENDNNENIMEVSSRQI